MTDVGVRPVVVGVDGSPFALHAVRWAAREAHRRAAPLRCVHVGPVPPEQETPPGDHLAALEDQGRQWLAQARAAALEVVADGTVTTAMVAGGPVAVLTGESAAAQLLVLGSRGLGGVAAVPIGSVAVALSAHAHCPLAVMHAPTVDGAPPETGPVVVGTDTSELSEGALTFAFEAAAARAAPLVVVHTWLDVAMTGEWTTLPWTVDWHRVQAEEEERLAERVARWRDRFPHVEVRTVVVKDRPERVLLEQAGGAQLVVVGTRGLGTFDGMGLGSVSQILVREAGCPVVVARSA